ncbi:MAG: hypothetical protein WCT18_03965 [Patescibacteria group bacterium]
MRALPDEDPIVPIEVTEKLESIATYFQNSQEAFSFMVDHLDYSKGIWKIGSKEIETVILIIEKLHRRRIKFDASGQLPIHVLRDETDFTPQLAVDSFEKAYPTGNIQLPTLDIYDHYPHVARHLEKIFQDKHAFC